MPQTAYIKACPVPKINQMWEISITLQDIVCFYTDAGNK